MMCHPRAATPNGQRPLGVLGRAGIMLLASDQLADKLEVVQRPILAGQWRGKLVESLKLGGKSPIQQLRDMD